VSASFKPVIALVWSDEAMSKPDLDMAGQFIAPAATAAYNPAFDVTPPSLITAIVTERGVLKPVTAGNLRDLGAGQEQICRS